MHPLTGAIRPVTSALLAETYLCPIPRSFDDSAAIRDGGATPWATSLAAAPEATIAAVSHALRDLIRSAPAFDTNSIEAEKLPYGRARTHLAALQDLWRDIGTLPEELAPLAHAETCSASDALEPLPWLASGDRMGATAADLRLADLLSKHHGSVERADAYPGLKPAGTTPELRAFQTREATPGAYSLRVTALRDPLEELRFAAARAQRLLDEDSTLSADEIGLLLPDDPEWVVDAEAIFAELGLHLGGLPGALTRDRTSETVHLLLISLRKPTPGMAKTALDALGLGTDCGKLRDLLNQAPSNGAELTRTLQALAGHMREPIGSALRAIPALPDKAPIDWDALIAAIRPGLTPEAPLGAAKGAVSVFTEGQTPWREVRHLLAIGFAGDRYPSIAGASPFWLEHEIDLIQRCCGITLFGRQRSLQMALARLDRLLSVASESIEITLPVRNRAGARLAPSAALDMLAHRLGKTAEDLIVPVSSDPSRWPCAIHHIDHDTDAGRPCLPEKRIIDLQRDLTVLRIKDGKPRPQSPSRLETLLVSPLAWLFGELGVEDQSWSPDTLDALVRGTLLHGALEILFPSGAPPAPETVADAVPDAVETVIRSNRDLRFLEAETWAVERAHLISDLSHAATKWAEILHETGATIHATEGYLTGNAFGMDLHGKADVVLRLEDGGLLVVDYKSGSSKSRVKRMETGWDVQAQLYGDMIAASDMVSGEPVSVGYLNLADMMIVSGGTLAGAAFGPVDADTHAEARKRLTATVADLRKGRITLNETSDRKSFEQVGIGGYALDHPLVDAFLWEET